MHRLPGMRNPLPVWSADRRKDGENCEVVWVLISDTGGLGNDETKHRKVKRTGVCDILY